MSILYDGFEDRLLDDEEYFQDMVERDLAEDLLDYCSGCSRISCEDCPHA
jgi:hypothetical protein